MATSGPVSTSTRFISSCRNLQSSGDSCSGLSEERAARIRLAPLPRPAQRPDALSEIDQGSFQRLPYQLRFTLPLDARAMAKTLPQSLRDSNCNPVGTHVRHDSTNV